MAAFQYKNQVLHCEGVPLDSAAKEVGTPFYAYSRKRLLDNFRTVEAGLAGTDHFVCFALKANANPHVVRLFAERGCGADVVSGGELLLALRAGIPADRIIYSGAGKTDPEIKLAVRHGIFALNAESFEEIEVIHEIASRLNKTARVSVRVNPMVDSKTHPYIATGLSESKFGVPAERALEACETIRSLPSLKLVGLHFHLGSMILETSPYKEAAECLAGLIRNLETLRIPLEFVDIGGGLGIDYASIADVGNVPRLKEPAPLTPKALFSAILPIFKEFKLKFLFEPGRFLAADAGALVTRVTFTKTTKTRRFAVLDAGMNDLIRPSLYDAFHQIVPVRGTFAPSFRYDVVGPVCESSDFFAHDRQLPEVRRGDLLAITGAGAYGYTLASNYNGRPRAPEILVSGSKFQIIRRRESVDVLWRGTEVE
jgi:diaminopimelate decarboxylase